MTKPFIVRINDNIHRRIIINKDAWVEENIKKGDYVEVKIKKINLMEDQS